jgi:hypothetical protein
MMIRLRSIISLAAVILAVAILTYLVWDINTPQPITIEDHVGEATVLFRSDIDSKLFAVDCVNISWQVDQIQAVYLNDDGKGGNGEEVYCSQIRQPTLRVQFRDETVKAYTLPIRTFANDDRFWLSLIAATALFLLAFSTAPIPVLRRWSNRFWSRLYAHLKAVKVTPEQLRLAQIMGYIFSLLNLILVITILRVGNFSPLLLIHLLLAVAGTIVGTFPRTHRFLAHVIQLRWMILLPVVWFIVTTSILLDVRLELVPRSAIRAWAVTLFFWLIIFWLISYVLRSFTFDRQRRFAWASIAGLFLIVSLIALTVPLLSQVQDATVMQNIKPSNLLYYYGQFTPDSVEYVRSSQNFPVNWRYMVVIHRPTFMMMTFQTCLLLDIPLYGYAAPYGGCSSDGTVIAAFWLTNFAVGLLSLLILYELVRIFSENAYVAWLAAMFAALSPFHIWTLAVPTTDYVEIFILHLSLWLTYRLFSERTISVTRIITYGLVFGLLLLIKLDVILYFFAMALIVVFRRWWLLPIWTVLPFGLNFLYTQFIPKWGVPYSTIELQGRWSPIRWIWLEYIYFTPEKMWRTLAEWGGYTAFQVIVAFGLLLVIAVFVLSLDQKTSRTIVPLGWLMYFSSAAFAFVARLSYTGHILELMPVIYGGVALGIWHAKIWLERYYAERPLLIRVVCLLLIALVVLHLLLQWFTFSTHLSRAIYPLLPPDVVAP